MTKTTKLYFVNLLSLKLADHLYLETLNDVNDELFLCEPFQTVVTAGRVQEEDHISSTISFNWKYITTNGRRINSIKKRIALCTGGWRFDRHHASWDK